MSIGYHCYIPPRPTINIKSIEDLEWQCLVCKQDIDVANDNWELAYDSEELEREVMYHSKCLKECL